MAEILLSLVLPNQKVLVSDTVKGNFEVKLDYNKNNGLLVITNSEARQM